jgi:two-component system response regulator AlgR
MRLLIADDEAPARQRLQSMVESLGADFQVVALAGNGYEVLDACRREAIDVVLLDIRMPGMDGIEAALELSRSDSPPAVVFVTAYAEHALAAFDANAIDYLLKPVRVERLQRALDKAVALNPRQTAVLSEAAAYLNASYRGRLLRIAVADVIFLRADSKYVEVWHDAGIALTDESLRAIEQRLPGVFQRVHRNALVARSRIRELRKEGEGALHLAMHGTDQSVEVSRRHAAELRRLLRGDD